MIGMDGLAGFADDTDVEFGETRFHIAKLPAVQARRTWRELLHAIGETGMAGSLGGLDLADAAFAPTALLVLVQGVLTLDVDYLERLQGQIFSAVTFQNGAAATPQPVGPAQEMAFMTLEPVEVDELLLRGLAVNFTPSLQRLVSRLGVGAPDTPPPNPSE